MNLPLRVCGIWLLFHVLLYQAKILYVTLPTKILIRVRLLFKLRELLRCLVGGVLHLTLGANFRQLVLHTIISLYFKWLHLVVVVVATAAATVLFN